MGQLTINLYLEEVIFMSKAKEQKKKDRERSVKAKMLRRREAIRAKAKKEREKAREDRKYERIANRVEGRTYINRDPETQHDLIHRNIKILEALEEQRQALDESAKNAPPLRELASKHALLLGEAKPLGAEVSFTPNPVNPEPLQVPLDFNIAGSGIVLTSAEEAQKRLVPQAEVVFEPKIEDTFSIPEQSSDVLKKAQKAWGKKKK